MWAEIDLNANLMLHGRVPQGDDVTGEEGLGEQRRPLEDGRAALIVRPAKNFAEADRIRDELKVEGVVLEDGPGGTTWRKA